MYIILQKDDFMDEEKLFIARINDLIEQVCRDHTAQNTGFLDPREQQLFLYTVKDATDIRIALSGGYRDAERRVGVIYPDYVAEQDLELPLGLVVITSADDFSRIKHRDVLGAVLSLGIKRSNVGDIVLLQDTAQVIALKNMTEFIAQNLAQIGGLKVTAVSIETSDIVLPEQRVKEIKTTVSSLRLDSVASTAFGMSRSKILPYIKGERVMVNWQVITKPAHVIEPGSTVSIRGRGRARLEEVQGKSQKGRVKVRILRFM
jgi:RNA-binding protein YlmH